MRKLLAAVLTASLLVSATVVAQDQPNPPRERGSRSQREQGAERPTPNRRPLTRPTPRSRPAPVARPSMGRRPSRHFRSQGRWRPSVRAPAFRYPPGFGYRRWASGAILPRPFLAAPYFYDNFGPLGLAPPPPGFRWVRYGPDLLLVNVVTGRIADVVDGVFF